jgi:hypothetical protein
LQTQATDATRRLANIYRLRHEDQNNFLAEKKAKALSDNESFLQRRKLKTERPSTVLMPQ